MEAVSFPEEGAGLSAPISTGLKLLLGLSLIMNLFLVLMFIKKERR